MPHDCVSPAAIQRLKPHSVTRAMPLPRPHAAGAPSSFQRWTHVYAGMAHMHVRARALLLPPSPCSLLAACLRLSCCLSAAAAKPHSVTRALPLQRSPSSREALLAFSDGRMDRPARPLPHHGGLPSPRTPGHAPHHPTPAPHAPHRHLQGCGEARTQCKGTGSPSSSGATSALGPARLHAGPQTWPSRLPTHRITLPLQCCLHIASRWISTPKTDSPWALL